ncbi:MAG: helix-turn-helix transcriptional regulator [Prochlorothrix sp.]|nr:helix-turn-helix transcriptional regulator [Prochlorothrix sp.]
MSSQARQVFARRLRQVRQQQALSQEALADRSGLHRTYVGAVERGERNISIDNMERLAQALQVPLTDLLQDSSHATPPR